MKYMCPQKPSATEDEKDSAYERSLTAPLVLRLDTVSRYRRKHSLQSLVASGWKLPRFV